MVNGDTPNFSECGPDHTWAWSKITNTNVGLRHVQKTLPDGSRVT